MGDEISRAREKVQHAIEEAEATQRQQILLKRIELAQKGLVAFKAKRVTDAVKYFHGYLRILEDWKGAPEGGLNPGLFDLHKDSAEILLIAGVYWDLVKIFDRTKTPGKYKEFLHYLEKYILFSNGMSFQPLSADTMRKYILVGRPVHKHDLKNAYKIIQLSKCFVATALFDVTHVETLPRLREFRDQTLSTSESGKAFVRWYYRNGPALAARVEKLPLAIRRALGLLLDGVAFFVARIFT